MISVKIPNNNINERKYIIDIIFKEFLGLDYYVEIGSQNYEIILENGNTLIIEDHFFNNFPNDLEYLKEENIPKSVEFAKNDFIVENNIPIIYGNHILKTNNQKLKTITCGIDIFASSFFMLTRWEEYVNKTRDNHNRFPAYASLAYKHNFLDRPVVNEYVEMLKNMLLYLGLNQQPKTKNYQLILTHDVDHAYKYKRFNNMLKELAGDLIKRKSIKQFFNTLSYQTKFLLNKVNDPFDTYDYLMDISEKAGVKSYFFLHSSNSAKQDVDNDKFLKQVSQKILKRGHYLGYHPSYNAYNDFELFIKDKEKIENIIGQKLTVGRAHFLRFEVPTTWQIWEDANMEWDSSLSYADREGFRCGACYEYSVFNILRRKKLNLKEKPLIVMEGSFVTYQPDISSNEMESKIIDLINIVKKYNGEFVFLWHNSSFNTIDWIKYNIYEKVIL
jgi:hypothetical protein